METRGSRLKDTYLLVQKRPGIILVARHRNLKNGDNDYKRMQSDKVPATRHFAADARRYVLRRKAFE